ncbi:hypothetical protein HJC23_007526 [Cyclotella cryptica]|uniref:Uncharacterized protein n=1 Tax=Cyclotella cryptica TaxID=29204 RepID=A0ABD3PVZ2_9STRA
MERQQALSSSSNNQDETICVRCSYPGSDARLLCPKRCAYHARCIDLIAIVNSQQPSGNNPASRTAAQDGTSIAVHTCPHCRSSADGLEILPLSFEGMDRAQRMNQGRLHDATIGGNNNHARMDSEDANFARKRSNTEMDEGKPNNSSSGGIPGMLLSSTPPVSSYSQSSSQCYDPTIPRTGRWTDEELAFRDSLISHFLEGSLPLSNGLKLNDFLSNILKSKQSRLTKKMKHAKLSTKYFHIKRGFLFDNTAAREFSRLEYSFIHVITDPIERSEIQFHMQREWREHLAERCSYLRIMFEGSAWVKSVEKCDHRVALEKNRTRTVKRRWMMGKAMERDVSEKVPGVFIDRGLEKEDLMDGLENDQDGDFGRFLMSILDDGGTGGKSFEHSTSSSVSNVAPSMKKAAYRSTFDSNFKCAAPFLAGIVSYVEKNAIPFEHVDLWVPSFIPPGDSEQMSMGSLGSGSNLAAFGGSAGDNRGVCRLCFAGSATMGVQVMPDDSINISSSLQPNDLDKKENVKMMPLSSDEIFNFSLYGDYSEKFSFSSRCGLPGRVFQSGVAAWEQFVANAPSHLFERRGGAIQFGIKTALGLPIESPNVGRIVLVLYSKHNREKDEELVKQIVKDIRLFTPCPRWKLVVDVNSSKRDESNNQLVRPANAQIAKLDARNAIGEAAEALSRQSMNQHVHSANSQNRDLPTGNNAAAPMQGTAQNETNSEAQIKNLISLLGENMPSDSTSPLGKQLHDLMSLRLVLLRRNRTPEEQSLVDTILILFESYLAAGRSRQDIALLVCRDFMFHTEQNQRASLLQQQQQQQRSLAGQQQLQNLNTHSNLGMMPSSLFQTLGLSQSLPSTHSHLGGQQSSLLHSNTYPQLALDQQQQQLMQQFNFPPSYLTNRPNSGQDDESLGTHSAGGPSRR